MANSTPLIVRLILNQFAMSIFGIMLAFSTIMINDAACAVISCIALFLYFYLIYTVMWEKGAKDIISEKEKTSCIFKGFLYSALAYIPTIVLTVIFSVITQEMTNLSNFANTLYTASKMILMFGFHGMYHGFANIFNYHFIFYIIALFPAIIIGGGAYMMGYTNKRILPEKKK